MIDSHQTWTLDHPQVIEAFERFVCELEQGGAPCRAALLSQFPGLEHEIEECLEGLELIHTSNKPPIPLDAFADSYPRLGDFRLLREVGRGGMGVVYEAEQLSLGRHVALKILPNAATLDARKIQRFENEARAAGCLHHPNIVPVYAVGQEGEVHYYAMQFISGCTLANPLHTLRRTAGLHPAGGDPKSSSIEPPEDTAPYVAHDKTTATTNFELDNPVKSLLEETYGSTEYYHCVAELARQAAEALDHAHQLGVIHRDMKPANILLDEEGHLWITDFGLAHLDSSTDLTMTGDLVGTLRYMSPEQAKAKRGLVDHRTDIYGLGATLYELLTLRPVFDGSNQAEVLQQVLRDEPRPLREWDSDIPIDLETIVLQTLAKNPEERYSTARELADDLGRFLRDESIDAKRPAWSARLGKWSRRHRGLLGAAVAVLLLLAVALGLSTYWVWREKAKTQLAYESESSQRRLAESRFRKAREMLDYFTRVVENDMIDSDGLDALRTELLNSSLAYYKEFIEQARPNPQLQKELSDSHFRVAAILERLGEREKARVAFHEAFDLHEDLVRNNPDDDGLRRSLNRKYRQWGYLESDEIVQQLQRTSVRTELEITDDQKTELDKLYRAYSGFLRQRPSFGRGGNSPWMRNFESRKKEMVKSLETLLTSDQHTRLSQIRLQLRGARAFADPAVQQHLKLTVEQLEKIDGLLYRQRRTSGRYPNYGRRTGPRIPEGKETLDSILASLTPEQRESWKALQGKPFSPPPRPTSGRWGGPGFRRPGTR